tara:strand:- start:4486 stop:5355 length:870 start_codon:yes stop_codon:yes gene_type:complete
MYFDEEIVLETRLNYLDQYVDYFVIIESCYTHRGDKRDLKFNINKFQKFKDKIIYKVYDKIPNTIKKVNDNDDEGTKSTKYIMNAIYRENSQRNYIYEGIKNAEAEDIILISDVDEIPNLSKNNLSEIDEKIILFKQDMFYYKFNLKLPETEWVGTKACKKKYLKSPQWLRNIKDRKYSFLRLDAYFSNNKYISVKMIDDGGWHFTNIKNAEQIEYKMKSYLHHREYDLERINLDDIKKIMRNKQAIYDLGADKRLSKIGTGKKLEKCDLNSLPEVIKLNLKEYKEWLD